MMTLSIQAQTLQPTFNGLTGYFTVYASESPDIREDGWGTSMYSAIHAVKPGKDNWTQLGWGWWILANPYENAEGEWDPVPTDSNDERINFCPQFPGSILFQSIEGGVGTWGNVKYPIASSMFLIAATGTCYTSGSGGPAYVPGAERALSEDELFFAQLSNRFVLPPNQVIFQEPTQPSLLGYGWIALPIVPENMSPYGIPTGPNNWTLFFNSANFKGAVGFFTPAMWSSVNKGQDPYLSVGYGLDSRNSIGGLAAMEIGFTNSFEAVEEATEYRRAPRLKFLVDENNRAPLEQDFTRYYKTAIWDAYQNWVNGGPAPTAMGPTGIWKSQMLDPATSVSMLDDHHNPDIDLGTTVKTATYDSPGGGAVFGLEWDGSLEVGVIPEYYKRVDGVWEPIPPSEVPDATMLRNQTFPELPIGTTPTLDTSESSPWRESGWAAGPFKTRLSNNTVVTYVWYRFIDQPAMARLPLSEADRTKLQAWAERVHDQGTNGLTIPPPSSGHLVSLDAGQIVMPPSGLERGYVPIAIGQQYVPPPPRRRAVKRN